VSAPRAVRSDPLRVVLHALEQGEDGECLPGDILVYEPGDTTGGTDVGRELKVDGEEADVGEWVFKVGLFEPEDKVPRSDFGKDGLMAQRGGTVVWGGSRSASNSPAPPWLRWVSGSSGSHS
jgi:hypothetical protein